ncbi:hypothetical protein KIPB_013924, partial [Kipferlia bialata]|eukprot:g13924.t1
MGDRGPVDITYLLSKKVAQLTK